VFLDVGQGDAALVQTAEGATMLIDAGGSMEGGPDPGAASVLPVLSALRIARLDVVVMSHPHPDHYGGLQAVLEALPVAELWDTGQAEAEGTQGAQRIVELARRRGARVRRPSELCGAPYVLGRARVSVLAPCPAFDEAYGANDNSFVLRLTHGKRSVLFTGDVETAAEARLAQAREPALRSDVLKVAHHGSRTSSTELFLAAVEPALAVVSAGRANSFGHPHAEVEARLTQLARVLRTDRVGGVRLWSDGERVRVSAFDPGVAFELP
jgi:competence protein ComEC